MGAWSHTPFGNDGAADWAAELAESSDLSVIEAAIDLVLDAGDGYLDASEAEEAIAAIEVLAQLLGRGTATDELPMNVTDWLASKPPQPTPTLLDKARQAARRIVGDDSELAELWDDSDSAGEWRDSMAELEGAVSAG